MALNREASDYYTLPFRLPAGRCRVSVYDIEHSGTVLRGVVYPAYTRNEFTVSGAQDQGELLLWSKIMQRLLLAIGRFPCKIAKWPTTVQSGWPSWPTIREICE